MIEFIESLDSASFYIGMMFSYIIGIIVSVINYYTEKALKKRQERHFDRKYAEWLENGSQERE